jgi:hypothetical protein
VVYFTFAIAPTTYITNAFGNLINRVDKQTKAQVKVGTCGILWSIWNFKNDVIFNKSEISYFLQVICKATH